MHWQMNGNNCRPFFCKSSHGAVTPVGGTIVHNPKDSFCGLIWLGVHDLLNQFIERRDPGCILASSKYLRPMDIPCGDICQRPQSFIFKLNSHCVAGLCGYGCVNATAGLDTRFLICADDIFVISKLLTIPYTMIQVQDNARLPLEIGITRENPAPVLPWLDCILAEPAPNCCPTNRGRNTSLRDQFRKFLGGESRQRLVEFRWQLTSQSLDLNHHLRGKKQGVSPAVSHPPIRQGVVRKTFSSIYLQSVVADLIFALSRRCAFLVRHIVEPLPSQPDNTVTYIFEQIFQGFSFPRASTKWCKDSFLACFSFHPQLFD